MSDNPYLVQEPDLTAPMRDDPEEPSTPGSDLEQTLNQDLVSLPENASIYTMVPMDAPATSYVADLWMGAKEGFAFPLGTFGALVGSQAKPFRSRSYSLSRAEGPGQDGTCVIPEPAGFTFYAGYVAGAAAGLAAALQLAGPTAVAATSALTNLVGGVVASRSMKNVHKHYLNDKKVRAAKRVQYAESQGAKEALLNFFAPGFAQYPIDKVLAQARDDMDSLGYEETDSSEFALDLEAVHTEVYDKWKKVYGWAQKGDTVDKAKAVSWGAATSFAAAPIAMTGVGIPAAMAAKVPENLVELALWKGPVLYKLAQDGKWAHVFELAGGELVTLFPGIGNLLDLKNSYTSALEDVIVGEVTSKMRADKRADVRISEISQ